MSDTISFLDLQAQRQRLGGRIEAAITRVLDHGAFILGPEVEAFEAQLAEMGGVAHAIGCANGTDALTLTLMAEGIGPGDAVIVPDFTFVATAEAPALVGATPVFVDVDEKTALIDPDAVGEGVAAARRANLTPRAVIAVDLFGQPADYAHLRTIAEDEGLMLISDAAQAFGAWFDGTPVTACADVSTTSFFPSKPLGCYGDGGAVLTHDGERAEHLRSLRMHGKGRDKYDNVRIGLNSRLDTLQAAILLEKITLLEDEIEARHAIAQRYAEDLGDLVETPAIRNSARSAWALYTIRSAQRDAIRAACAAANIPTAIYYPTPLSRQAAYRDCPAVPGGTPRAAQLAETVLSLPLHPALSAAQCDRVVAAVRQGVRQTV